jgi:hypothetical protein
MLLLASCAITPPVLGGPFADDAAPPTAGGPRTDEDVAALLILGDPESPLGASSVADDLADAQNAAPEVDPAPCRDSTVALVLFDRDGTAEGTVFRPPTLFRDAPGADLLVTQVARRFASPADADDFLGDLRAARSACPAYTTADGSTVEQAVVAGDLAVSSAGFAVTVTSGDGSSIQTYEWVLVEGDVAISLRADLLDEDAAATLRALAEEYADRLIG